MARIATEQLTKVFTRPGGERMRAVDEVSLAIEEGELLVLLGPSGCGKTTLLRLLAGLEEPTAGTIRIDGQAANDWSPKERDMAMVFQNPALYPHLSVYDNLAFGLKLRGWAKRERAERVAEAAAMLGLTDCLERRPMELSGGQRQRVALGRALVRRPRVILLDEPLSNLDAPLRARMRLELVRLHQRLGTTMVYVTHDQSEAMALGRRMAVMNEGAMAQTGEPREVYERPANLFVAGFLGSPPMNFYRGRLVKTSNGLVFQTAVQGAGAGSALPIEPVAANGLEKYVGRGLVLGLRPEGVGSSLPGPSMEGTVELVERWGTEIYAHLNQGVQSLVARVGGGSEVKVGQRLQVNLDLRQALFFEEESGKRISE